HRTLEQHSLGGGTIKHITKLLSVLFVLSFAQSAWAACVVNGTSYKTITGSGTKVTRTQMLAWSSGDVTTCDVTDSSLSNMSELFMNKTVFDQDLSAWDTSSVTDMNKMFYNALSLTSVTLPTTGNVTNMSYMFYNATSLTSVSLPTTGKVQYMFRMFYAARALTSVTLQQTGDVTDMNRMFYNATSLTSVTLPTTGIVTNMRLMFGNATSLTSVSLPQTGEVTNMSNMFDGASAFNQNIRGWDVDDVTNFGDMFKNATLMLNTYSGVSGFGATPTASFFDSTAPTMTITAAEVSDGGTSNDATLSLTFTSSEATTNFVVGDITVSGGALSNFAATSSTVYTATLTPTASGVVAINVAGGAFTDAASNTNTNTSISWLYDGTAPTLSSVSIASINSTNTQAVADDVVTLTFTASETIGTPVVTFKSGGDAITDTSITYANSGNVHTAKYTVDTDDTAGSVTYSIAFADTAGNAGTSVTSGTGSVTFDATAPTMAITASEVSDGGTSNDGTLSLTFTSSESTSNFLVGDITVNGGALSSFAGSGTTYTATFTPSASGATTIDVASSKFTDAAGNNNTAATQFNWTYDSTAACTVNGQDYRTIYETSGTYITLDKLTDRAGSWNNGTDIVTTCDVSQFTSMYEAFKNNSTFNQDLSAWDTSAVTSMHSMFRSATSLTSVTLPKTCNVTDMSVMFRDATSLTSVTL
ncbi:BspA family leucine-rich repeat surface protein, partial [Planktomarina temperata]|nr:BspA family leucine-rich repeat surface protein [Planktomarina temperata]